MRNSAAKSINKWPKYRKNKLVTRYFRKRSVRSVVRMRSVPHMRSAYESAPRVRKEGDILLKALSRSVCVCENVGSGEDSEGP